MSDEWTAKNTDRELWREREGDYYADSLFVTKDGGIGMNVGGTVHILTLKEWHERAGGVFKLSKMSTETSLDIDLRDFISIWVHSTCQDDAWATLKAILAGRVK